MDEIITIILAFGVVGVLGIFLFYIFKIYFAPKKLDQLADMIRTGQLGPAVKRLQNAVEENSRDSFAHFLLAEAYYAQGNEPQAILEYKKVLSLGRFDSKVREEIIRSRLAKLYLKSKNLDEAKKEFLILTKLDPSNADNFYQVGLLFQNVMAEKALSYFKQAAKINPTHAEAFLHQGTILHALGNVGEAKQNLVQAVKLNPSLSEAHYYLGLCLKSQKDYDWSIREFELSLKDHEYKVKSHLGIGLCHMERENHSKAIKDFEHGLQDAPKNSELELNLRYFIAACAEKQRDMHNALDQWSRISDINPHFRDVAEKLKTYEELRTEDTIKDFMIATPGNFEQTSKDLISSLGLKLIDLKIESDSEVHALGTESETKWRNTKMSNRLIYIFRTTDAIQEKTLRKMHQEMRQRNATKGVCLTTSTFTAQAELFCQSRPIELIDRQGMISHLRSMN